MVVASGSRVEIDRYRLHVGWAALITIVWAAICAECCCDKIRVRSTVLDRRILKGGRRRRPRYLTDVGGQVGRRDRTIRRVGAPDVIGANSAKARRAPVQVDEVSTLPFHCRYVDGRVDRGVGHLEIDFAAASAKQVVAARASDLVAARASDLVAA